MAPITAPTTAPIAPPMEPPTLAPMAPQTRASSAGLSIVAHLEVVDVLAQAVVFSAVSVPPVTLVTLVCVSSMLRPKLATVILDTCETGTPAEAAMALAASAEDTPDRADTFATKAAPDCDSKPSGRVICGGITACELQGISVTSCLRRSGRTIDAAPGRQPDCKSGNVTFLTKVVSSSPATGAAPSVLGAAEADVATAALPINRLASMTVMLNPRNNLARIVSSFLKGGLKRLTVASAAWTGLTRR